MEIIPIHIQKEIDSTDDIANIILESASLYDGDIIVIAQKIISKQEGRLVDLSKITPSLLAQGIATQYGKDPRIIELILSESKRIIKMARGILIVETRHGFICANAGIDESNVAQGFATLLPIDSDVSAKRICDKISNQSKKNIAIIISDTFGRPFRMGQTNHAIGISGLKPVLNYEGTMDSFNRVLRVTAIAIADELASASELVMGKSLKCPIAIIRGYTFESKSASISELIRQPDEDLFR